MRRLQELLHLRRRERLDVALGEFERLDPLVRAYKVKPVGCVLEYPTDHSHYVVDDALARETVLALPARQPAQSRAEVQDVLMSRLSNLKFLPL